ncbi:MAG: hypothetical protein ACRCTE_12465 [Cellulosilyticaceae bacterium]
MNLKITELIDLINTNYLTTLAFVAEKPTESLEKMVVFLKQCKKIKKLSLCMVQVSVNHFFKSA